MIEHEVIVVGGGPAGLGAAVGALRNADVRLLICERSPRLGGVPAKYRDHQGSIATFVDWTRGRLLVGEKFVQGLVGQLEPFSFSTELETTVLSIDPKSRTLVTVSPRGKHVLGYRALILACGSRERTLAERPWVAGDRPARVYHTMQILDLIEGNHAVPLRHPAVLGSDLIALAAAAKLRRSGAKGSVIVEAAGLRSTFWERWYFTRYGRTRMTAQAKETSIAGHLAPERIETSRGELACDGVVLAGDLIPNSELAMEAGLPVSLPDRVPRLGSDHSLADGIFACGNILGGFRGARWCFSHGKKVGRTAARWLTKSTDDGRAAP